jgi:hypothetical protein
MLTVGKLYENIKSQCYLILAITPSPRLIESEYRAYNEVYVFQEKIKVYNYKFFEDRVEEI